MQMCNHDIFPEHTCKNSIIMFYCIIKRKQEGSGKRKRERGGHNPYLLHQ